VFVVCMSLTRVLVLDQGDCVRSLHDLNKSARVGERQGRTKVFLNFLCSKMICRALEGAPTTF